MGRWGRRERGLWCMRDTERVLPGRAPATRGWRRGPSSERVDDAHARAGLARGRTGRALRCPAAHGVVGCCCCWWARLFLWRRGRESGGRRGTLLPSSFLGNTLYPRPSSRFLPPLLSPTRLLSKQLPQVTVHTHTHTLILATPTQASKLNFKRRDERRGPPKAHAPTPPTRPPETTPPSQRPRAAGTPDDSSKVSTPRAARPWPRVHRASARARAERERETRGETRAASPWPSAAPPSVRSRAAARARARLFLRRARSTWTRQPWAQEPA